MKKIILLGLISLILSEKVLASSIWWATDEVIIQVRKGNFAPATTDTSILTTPLKIDEEGSGTEDADKAGSAVVPGGAEPITGFEEIVVEEEFTEEETILDIDGESNLVWDEEALIAGGRIRRGERCRRHRGEIRGHEKAYHTTDDCGFSVAMQHCRLSQCLVVCI